MKIWLDDERPAPEGWIGTHSAFVVISRLKHFDVEVISLDHDLGDEKLYGTGYDVLTWIEQQVVENGYEPPEIRIHTANPVARKRMEAAVREIKELTGKED